jgi:hypothetical protein
MLLVAHLHFYKRTKPDKKCKRATKPSHNYTTMDRITTTEKEGRRHNSGFAKKRVQWLIEHSTSHQLLWYVDSVELRNPLLRKAANR